MKKASEIFDEYTSKWLSSNRICYFEDIPNEVFHDAMKAYANQWIDKTFKAGYSSCQDDYTNDEHPGQTIEEYKQSNPLL